MKEIGGSVPQRKYWNRYFKDQVALIYVIDCSAHECYNDSVTALIGILENSSAETLEGPVLVLANKQDVAGAISSEQLEQNIRTKSSRDVMVRPCVGTDHASALGVIQEFVTCYFLTEEEKIAERSAAEKKALIQAKKSTKYRSAV